MRKSPPAEKAPRPHERPARHAPLSDADRLPRGLPLESGEPQPGAVRRLH